MFFTEARIRVNEYRWVILCCGLFLLIRSTRIPSKINEVETLLGSSNQYKERDSVESNERLKSNKTFNSFKEKPKNIKEHGSIESGETHISFKDRFFLKDYKYNLRAEHGIADLGSNATALAQRKSYGNDNYNRTVKGELRPNNGVTYGLLHMAKTGGTTINGELAMNYERVCGNKGYSQDYYAHNLRINANKRGKRMLYNMKINRALILTKEKRFISSQNIHQHGHFSNQYMHQVAHIRMNLRCVLAYSTLLSFNTTPICAFSDPLQFEQIGFKDCDYVANEIGARFWLTFFASSYRPLELHVPCREPIDLFLSMCNHRQVDFPCRRKSFIQDIHKCLKGDGPRFDLQVLTHSNIHLKCFSSPSKIGDYLDYMGEKLQKKEVATKYTHRDSNIPRNKPKECLSKPEHSLLKVEVLKYLTRETVIFKDYSAFCRSCINSENELFRL